jgi:tryptophanyl-tRNA synthetase
MPSTNYSLPVILTGDRATGALHLGHYVGSLRNRVELQDTHEQYILVADAQALTDNADNPGKVRDSIIELLLDYLAVGIDPDRSVICLQSALPALSELSILYMNFVSVSRLKRIPTVKDEIQARGFGRHVPAGFLCYPVAQAVDITAFRASLVPVGEDQAPIIELTNELVRRLNRRAGRPLLPETKALIPKIGRLPGVNGKTKMSKSEGNAIPLSATDDQIEAAVNGMYTDPGHLKVSDPGRVEGNVVFTFLDAFDPDTDAVSDLKAHYRRGGLGDAALKQRLARILKETIGPIRERRTELARNKDYLTDVLRSGTSAARARTEETKEDVFGSLGLFRL